ncbi:MAG: hypothetical protein J1G01_01740 [Clostridiales bacterium]|nr:hypothetical protein [Clostridiales bacterium]
MKIKKFFKINVLPVLIAASVPASGFAMTGCGNDNSNKEPYISEVVNSINLFLSRAKYEQNFTSITNQPNVYSFTYYGDGDKFQIDYDDSIIYGIVEEDNIYKISQSNDLSWHKSTDIDDMRNPKDQISSLISKLNVLYWNEYNSKTKTLKCELTDGIATATLIANELTVNFIYTDGTEKSLEIIVKDVGTTVVTLPENIIDDTQNI